MGEALLVRRGSATQAAPPTVNVIQGDLTGLTFTLTNNDSNTAIVSYEIDGQFGAVELAAAATSAQIFIKLPSGTYTFTAYASVLKKIVVSDEVSIQINIPAFDVLFDSGQVDSDTQQIDITGLNIDNNDELLMVYSFVSAPGTTLYSIQVNDITTNYTNFVHFHSGGSAPQLTRNTHTQFTQAKNSSFGAAANSGTPVGGTMEIRLTDNNRFITNSAHLQDNNFRNSFILNTAEISTITKLSIIASLTDGIFTNSRIVLYQVYKEVV